MFSAGEISPARAEAFGPAAGKRVFLFPLSAGGRAMGVLYAESGNGSVDANALEILATSAAAIWNSREGAATAPALLHILPAPEPAWTALSQEEQDVHRKAQRFARVQVAEMRLYKSQAVKDGRSGHNLYGALSEEIAHVREEYRRQFMDAAPSMVDYLHLELVRTLAHDDASMLGADYPGPLA
jgi:hypothetical protein